MRSVLALSVALLLPAPPAWSQSVPPTLGPRTLVPNMVVCADVPVRSPASPALKVLAGHNTDGHTSLRPGDLVVLGGGDFVVGQRYIARRVGRGAYAMVQGADRIEALQTTGWLTVTARDEHSTLARIDFACTNVEPGDAVEPVPDLSLPADATGQGAPDYANRGVVLFGSEHRQSFGDGDVFSIDRGSADGISTGARIAIFRDRPNGLPLVYLGDAVVVDVAEHTSKVVLVMARDAIHAGDIAVRRKAP